MIDSSLPPGNSRFSEAVVWYPIAITAFLIVYEAFRLLAVARLDSNTALTILGQAGLAAFVVGTIITFVPALLSVSFSVASAYLSTARHLRGNVPIALSACIVLLVLSFCYTPWLLFVIQLPIVIVAFGRLYWTHRVIVKQRLAVHELNIRVAELERKRSTGAGMLPKLTKERRQKTAALAILRSRAEGNFARSSGDAQRQAFENLLDLRLSEEDLKQSQAEAWDSWCYLEESGTEIEEVYGQLRDMTADLAAARPMSTLPPSLRAPWASIRLQWWVALFQICLAVILSLSAGFWLPEEAIHIGSARTAVAGYVLSTNESGSVILVAKNANIIRLGSSVSLHQENCAAPGSLSRSVLQIVIDNKTLEPRCP